MCVTEKKKTYFFLVRDRQQNKTIRIEEEEIYTVRTQMKITNNVKGVMIFFTSNESKSTELSTISMIISSSTLSKTK